MSLCFIKCLELVLSSKNEKYSLKTYLYDMIKMFLKHFAVLVTNSILVYKQTTYYYLRTVS